MLPSPHGSGLGFWGFRFSRPYLRSLSLRPDDSLTILKMALSTGFGDSVSLHSAIQATRLLTVTSVGLPPTEHTSFSWTRFRTAGFPGTASRPDYQTRPAQRTGWPSSFVLSASIVMPFSVSGMMRLPAPPCGRIGRSTPGALAPVRVVLSRSILAIRPHPPHSRAHPDFTVWRLIRDAFAVQTRVCLGDPRLVLSFH